MKNKTRNIKDAIAALTSEQLSVLERLVVHPEINLLFASVKALVLSRLVEIDRIPETHLDPVLARINPSLKGDICEEIRVQKWSNLAKAILDSVIGE